ncbi:AfsR/SARP family transcriptional regulator [Winogradskya humida]|uniref:OmpR/PhoB-type domain-containing protein n=1 Tax=Winogradskya humida TaxID=113566 RepID=A0ABQ4A757_9ACTN|nr:AfsR/SARP family transcriptional regulator [Actinoplanes humidus]GIE26152.1 hypothetical protein Ahu01nite_092540 [Actinoplanes humidus]
MQFRVLGPLEILADDTPVRPGGTRQRIVLGCLLLEANRPVPVARLIDAVYGTEVPPTARVQTQICISALRRLFASHGRPDAIRTCPQGYAFDLGPAELDLHRHDELVRRARAAGEANRPGDAARDYRAALALWRGPALQGLPSTALRAAAGSVDERRITVTEDCIEAELGLGLHRDLVGELTELVAAHPLRERLRGQLALALRRCGRRVEAPARSLPGPSTSPGPLPLPLPGPSTLPADTADFVGRAEQLAAVRRILTATTVDDPHRHPAPVVVVGRPGAGKTALVVHAAHRLAESFPGGRFFGSLHGLAAVPVDPAGFGIPRIPAGRTLLVLDDPADEEQVRALLPGVPAAAVLIASRRRLPGIPGAVHIDIDGLDREQSTELLTRIVGAGRVRAEPVAAAELADRCGHLPLAVRIAGARLAARPQWALVQFAARLADETRIIGELTHGSLSVRGSLAPVADALPAPARRLFHLLGLLDFPVFSSWAGAALLDAAPREAAGLLDTLADARLLDTVAANPGPDRQYRFHTLIRAYARERGRTHEPPEQRRAAVRRALVTLSSLAAEAYRRLAGPVAPPAPDTRDGLPEALVRRLVDVPLSWFEGQRSTLIAGIRQAARSGYPDLSLSLAISTAELAAAGPHRATWREAHDVALDAARRLEQRFGQPAPAPLTFHQLEWR